jgi:hypothetical protein
MEVLREKRVADGNLENYYTPWEPERGLIAEGGNGSISSGGIFCRQDKQLPIRDLPLMV